jgi:hypothetical protein
MTAGLVVLNAQTEELKIIFGYGAGGPPFYGLFALASPVYRAFCSS